MPDDPLDIEQPDALAAYLRGRGRIGADEPVRIRTLAGGVSNKTVLVERPSGEAWVLKQALPKLRVAVDWFSDPARIHREALGLRYLAELSALRPVTPRLVFEDPEQHLLAMAAVPQPHENWKTMLLMGRVVPSHVSEFASVLGLIHNAGWPELRATLAGVFDDRSFFESLRLEPYYLYTATRVPAAAAFLRRLVADTRDRRLTLVHGDYSPKNVLVRGDRLVLLDHEVMHWGDPAFDVGFAMTHLLSKARHLPAHRAAFLDAAARFWKDYSAAVSSNGWSVDLEGNAVRHTLACMLARVAGRSPLEYLSETEKELQQEAVIQLMSRPPTSIGVLVATVL